MRKVYTTSAIVMRPHTQSNEFNLDIGKAIKEMQEDGNEVEVQTQNVKDHFAVLLLGYKKAADYTDY